MSGFFSKVAVVASRSSMIIKDSIVLLSKHLSSHGVSVYLDDPTAALFPDLTIERLSTEELGEMDLVVVVGGDGSILGYGRTLSADSTPVVGVNRGGLGFLAAISPDQIEEKFAEILEGGYLVEEHFLIQAEVVRAGETVACQTALNDVVLDTGRSARMLEFELWIDDAYVYNQKSDGLIIATPTGSTAYSLSAGGPIMHPSLDAIVIVPMFPHTLTSRPLVVPSDKTLRVKLLESVDDEPQVSCDSQVHVPLVSGDELVVQRLAAPLRLLYPREHNFYEACRSKLDWGSRLGDRSKNS